ncbi:molybdopterin-dependent oxidoreductase [Clostridium sp. NSJ-145]|uniref:molybdopterin-dependent oxidoreductase n=1 Tax=Clostridium sp. NSJ-145 TaxID=2897777 RepID=UPI001E62DDA6|nr:molybdopterin-dependent oxidoreductase [Clostridium sp. NSJ-145]MCD2500957.1 molybdopterin-dependent oxidoreductase [Clostridium sp. NSJ-145]
MKKFSHGCTLDCADCCKFNVYKDGNNIKIQGDKEHPYTKGFICKKGLAHLERLNHPKRIYSPLIKVNGKWKEINFEEALDILSEKLSFYKEKYSTRSIMYYEQYGNGSLLKSIGDIFFNFYGGVSKSKGGPCWSAGIAAQKLDFGSSKSHSLEDMINSNNIFIWGKNPANTTIHTMQMIKKAKANGSKIIVIDPIYTDTAKISDKYIRVNPGGDCALALAIGKYIVENNLCDLNYVESYVNGFDRYRSYLKSLKYLDLVKKSGVSLEEIEKLANIYTDKYSTILLGYGLQKYSNGGNTIRAIDTLGAITGQIGVSGGGVNYANKTFASVLDTDPYKSYNYANNRYFYTSHLADFINDTINHNDTYRENIYSKNSDDLSEEYRESLKMAVITKSNLLNQLPDLNNLKKAFSKIEFKVCFDIFMTDTAQVCDLFIPTTSSLESEDLLFSSMMNPYIIYNEKIIEPKNKFMDEYYFFRELAKKLNLIDYPNVSKKEYLNKVIAPLKEYYKDISLDKIKNSYVTLQDSIPWSDNKFLTSSGKFEIDIKPEAFTVNNKNNFRLLTNHSKETLFSQHMMDKKSISKVYINKKMANNIFVYDKEVVKLKSENGSIKAEVSIDESIADNIAMMYVGWWEKHGNPNFITVSEISDIGGQVTYNETFIQIEKI